MRLGVITGLTREADCLTDTPAASFISLRCTGTRPGRAGKIANEFIAEGCDGLISFGTAGGLAPQVPVGTLIVADAVVDSSGRRFETAVDWRKRLVGSLENEGNLLEGTVFGSETALTTPSAKTALYDATGALAVDMESHEIAAAANESGVPLLVVRAVSDTSGQAVPEWLLAGINDDGGIRYGAVITGLMRRPWDIAALLALAGDSNRALRTLRRVAGAAGPTFGLT